MPWLGTGEEVEVRGEKRQFWQLEWAEYTQEFHDNMPDAFGQSSVDAADGGSSLAPGVGHRVVRRLLVQETQLAYPGLTQAAADAKMKDYLKDYKYQGSRSTPNGAGGYTVTVTERLYDPAGWSNWIDAATLPEYADSSGGGT